MVMDGRDKTLWVLDLSSVLHAAPAGLWLGAGGAGEHAMGVCGVWQGEQGPVAGWGQEEAVGLRLLELNNRGWKRGSCACRVVWDAWPAPCSARAHCDRRVPDLLQAPPRPPSGPSAAGTSLLTANCPGATFEYKCYLTFGGVKKTQVGKCVCVTSERATAPSWNGK